MKQAIVLFGSAVVMAAFASCNKNADSMSPEQTGQMKSAVSTSRHVSTGGDIYSLSNQASGNMVMVYSQATNGTLTYKTSYSTGGNGTGAGLGSESSVTTDGDVLVAVNAASSTISSYKITPNKLNLMSTVSSGGTTPVSVTMYGDLVYVLNAGGTANISGFMLQGNSGKLNAIPNSTKPLSTNNPGPAQVAFVNNGQALAITEKGTSMITSYTVTSSGTPGTMHTLAATTATPFGFGTGANGNIFVSHAAGGGVGASTVSSYRIAANGVITLVQGPIATGQTAACWVAISPNGSYAYVTNAGSANVSSLNTDMNTGSMSLILGAAAASGNSPIDAVTSGDYLYVLNAASHTITAYSGAQSGSLTLIQTVTGLPVGAVGLAAE
jgi:6-phosphogluconolactonase (cycloisomerase 2 family)